MQFNVTKRSLIRYSLVVFLILVLFLFSYFYYRKDTKIEGIRNNISRLISIEQDYSKIDSAMYLLYQAESKSFLYTVTKDSRDLQSFSAHIQELSTLINSIYDHSGKKADRLGFAGKDEIKTKLNESYFKIRDLTDRLLIGFTKLGVISGADAVSGRLKGYDAARMEKIRDGYRQLFDQFNIAGNNEDAVLTVNNKLIAEIIDVLDAYKRDEILYFNQNKTLLEAQLQEELKGLDRIAFVNGILLFSLILVIFFTMVKLLNNELVLVALNKRAAHDVHSKSRFLANMSHEIRTPLNSIVGFSEQLSKSQLSKSQEDQITAIRSSSEMLLSVVNEILDFSKFEVGKIHFEKLPFYPRNEIMEVFNSMKVLAEQKGIDLKADVVVEQNLLLTGDRFRLKQVIMNLLTNAIKFTSKGHVMLKVQYVNESRKLEVQIEDSGIGMAQEDLDLIFDEFSQVNLPSKTEQQGTGLGLAICKKIVESQNGKIAVSSVLGKGSTFSFEIPYEATTPVEGQTIVHKASGAERLAGKRILLVDDNKMNVFLAQTILKKWNVVYDSAYDGKEALEMFKKNNYDMVLTDIQMPIMGGVELTHEIRYNGEESKCYTPILGITAHVMEENKDIYLKAGMNDLVFKPFLENELLEKINRYI